MSSLGKFDFLLTTAWCYLVVKLLPYYDTPIELITSLDSLTREDRFNLIYAATSSMTTKYFYSATLDQSVVKGFDIDNYDPMRNNDAGTLKLDNYYSLTKDMPKPKNEADDGSSAPSDISLIPIYDAQLAAAHANVISSSASDALLDAPSQPADSYIKSDYDLACELARDVSSDGPAPSFDRPDEPYSHASATELMHLPLRLNHTDSEIDVEKCWENVVRRLANPGSEPRYRVGRLPTPDEVSQMQATGAMWDGEKPYYPNAKKEQ
jgi:hypothetical protein